MPIYRWLSATGVSRMSGRQLAVIGAGLLVVGKVADGATTAIGLLLYPSLVERNPFLSSVIAGIGVLPGVAIGTVLTIATIILITETGADLCRHLAPDRRGPQIAVRLVGYVPVSLVYTAAAVSNAYLIGRAITLG